jgi:hypothetical protein
MGKNATGNFGKTGGVSGTISGTTGRPPPRFALQWTTFDDARVTRLANRSRERRERSAKVGGEAGIRRPAQTLRRHFIVSESHRAVARVRSAASGGGWNGGPPPHIRASARQTSRELRSMNSWPSPMLGLDEARRRRAKSGGEAGIRTLGRAFRPYNGLANRRLQPLGHLTAEEFLSINDIAGYAKAIVPTTVPDIVPASDQNRLRLAAKRAPTKRLEKAAVFL